MFFQCFFNGIKFFFLFFKNNTPLFLLFFFFPTSSPLFPFFLFPVLRIPSSMVSIPIDIDKKEE